MTLSNFYFVQLSGGGFRAPLACACLAMFPLETCHTHCYSPIHDLKLLQVDFTALDPGYEPWGPWEEVEPHKGMLVEMSLQYATITLPHNAAKQQSNEALLLFQLLLNLRGSGVLTSLHLDERLWVGIHHSCLQHCS